MRDLMLAAVAAFICVAPTAFGQTQHDTSTLQEMQKSCKNYDAAWNARGPVGVADFYAQDITVVGPNGHVLQGRDAVIKAFAAGWKEGAKHVCTVNDGEVIGNAAWLIGESQVTGLDKPVHVRWTAFDVKNGEKWEVKTMSISPIAEK